MNGSLVLRLTGSASYRKGSEVLLVDSGPFSNLACVRDALSEIAAALDSPADLLFERGAELVIRVAKRRFQRHYEPPRPQKRADRELEF